MVLYIYFYFIFFIFSQKVDLTVRIREILQVYPDGSIFKEMIQNADDAQVYNIRDLHKIQ